MPSSVLERKENHDKRKQGWDPHKTSSFDLGLLLQGNETFGYFESQDCDDDPKSSMSCGWSVSPAYPSER